MRPSKPINEEESSWSKQIVYKKENRKSRHGENSLQERKSRLPGRRSHKTRVLPLLLLKSIQDEGKFKRKKMLSMVMRFILAFIKRVAKR